MKVIKIGATWCNGCIVMKPRWAEIEQENSWLNTEFYDYDEHPEIVEKYRVNENLPVAIVLDDNDEELKRFSGEVEKDELLKTLKALLSA